MWLVATVPDNIDLEASFWNPQALGTVLDPKSTCILKVPKGFFIASLFEHREAEESTRSRSAAHDGPRAGVGWLAGCSSLVGSVKGNPFDPSMEKCGRSEGGGREGKRRKI